MTQLDKMTENVEASEANRKALQEQNGKLERKLGGARKGGLFRGGVVSSYNSSPNTVDFEAIAELQTENTKLHFALGVRVPPQQSSNFLFA